MIDTQELRDRTLEAAAALIQELTNCRWDDAMDAARAVMDLPAIAALPELAGACEEALMYLTDGCNEPPSPFNPISNRLEYVLSRLQVPA